MFRWLYVIRPLFGRGAYSQVAYDRSKGRVYVVIRATPGAVVTVTAPSGVLVGALSPKKKKKKKKGRASFSPSLACTVGGSP